MKALRRAVRDVFDQPMIARCQLHKIRDVRDRLPERLRGTSNGGCGRPTTPTARSTPKRSCSRSPANLSKTHPARRPACAKGLDETLTRAAARHPAHTRTLRSTNAIESMISICRDHASDVKRWRDGKMALRWCAAGTLEAGEQFRRVNGHIAPARLT